MEGLWPIIFLAVVLKIPVFFAIWLVWWASRPVPEVDDAPEAEDHSFGRWRREPKPRGPRRGPHGGGARTLPECPPGARLRVASQAASLTAEHRRASTRERTGS